MANNWIIIKVRQYQVWTFTLLLLVFNGIVNALGIYFRNKESYIDLYKENIGWYLVLIMLGSPIFYILYWLLGIYIMTKNPAIVIHEKLTKHPKISITIILIFLAFLPFLIPYLDEFVGLSKTVYVFDILINYCFFMFLFWLLFCWISNMINKTQINWLGYNIFIDKTIAIVPPIYKIILGIISSIYIIQFIIYVVLKVFN